MLKVLILVVFCVQKLLPEQLASETEVAEKLYIKLFQRQRAEQLEAIKSFKRISNYEKQYSMIMLMAEKIFSVVQESRAVIEASPYIPGVSDFPLDDDTRNALSNILENIALFSEIVLRFPDISTSILRTNNNWDVILQWGITFSYQVKYLLDNSTVKLLHLVSQELNLVERDPDYLNPYRKSKFEINATDEHKTSKKKKTIKKGPRFSSNFEL